MKGWARPPSGAGLIGFYLAFMPLYVLGLDGHDTAYAALRQRGMASHGCWSRRLAPSLSYAGVVFQIIQLVYSIRHREELRDETGDPWDGRSLEWATAVAAAGVQFRGPAGSRMAKKRIGPSSRRARIEMRAARRIWNMRISKCRGTAPPVSSCAFFATFLGFALIWHIWWLVGLAFLCSYATFVVFAWRDLTELNTLFRPRRLSVIDRAHRHSRKSAVTAMVHAAMTAAPATATRFIWAARKSNTAMRDKRASSSATVSGFS